MDYKKFIEDHTMECDYTRRGGNLKVDVSELFPGIDNAVMGAYQNYLGGGMLGAVCGGAMFTPDQLSKKDQKRFHEILEAIKKYFYFITNEEAVDWDEWSKSGSYEEQQRRPASAY
jgi:hypothetical protein